MEHSKYFQQAIDEMMSSFPPEFREKSRFGKGIEAMDADDIARQEAKTARLNRRAEIAEQNAAEGKHHWARILQTDGTFAFEWSETAMDDKGFQTLYRTKQAIAWDAKREVCGKDLKTFYQLGIGGEIYRTRDNMEKKLPKMVVLSLKNKLIAAGPLPVPDMAMQIFNGPVRNGVLDGNYRVDAKYWLPNWSNKELEGFYLIQTLWGNIPPFEKHLTRYDKRVIGGIDFKDGSGKVIAFVDGGINSAANRKAPWFSMTEEVDGNLKVTGYSKNYFNKNTLNKDPLWSFILHDVPIAISDYCYLMFENHVVIYNEGAKTIRIVGVVQWGFDVEDYIIKEGVKVLNAKMLVKSPTMKATNKFSAKSKIIWNNDYGNNKDYNIIESIG